MTTVVLVPAFIANSDSLALNLENRVQLFTIQRDGSGLEQLRDYDATDDAVASQQPDSTASGDFLFFSSNAPIAECNPDRPRHFFRTDLRSGLGSITIDRLGRTP